MELADGTAVGTVREIVHGPGGELLVVARPDGPDALVPFVREIVPTVDLEGGRVVLTPPEGLLDLSQWPVKGAHLRVGALLHVRRVNQS